MLEFLSSICVCFVISSTSTDNRFYQSYQNLYFVSRHEPSFVFFKFVFFLVLKNMKYIQQQTKREYFIFLLSFSSDDFFSCSCFLFSFSSVLILVSNQFSAWGASTNGWRKMGWIFLAVAEVSLSLRDEKIYFSREKVQGGEEKETSFNNLVNYSKMMRAKGA